MIKNINNILHLNAMAYKMSKRQLGISRIYPLGKLIKKSTNINYVILTETHPLYGKYDRIVFLKTK